MLSLHCHMKNILYKNLLLIIFISGLLVGCTGVANMGKTSAELLQERVELRWQALIKKDWNAAYQFELPAYRQTHAVSQYQAKFGSTLQWKSIHIDAVAVNAETDTADVRLTLVYSFSMPGFGLTEGNSQINERWMRQDNEWWMVD